jgi:hypothetical protein
MESLPNSDLPAPKSDGTVQAAAKPAQDGNAASLIYQLPAAYRTRVASRLAELDQFIAAGLIPSQSIKNALVVDWEAGDAAFSVAFLMRGAKHVFAIDTWMNVDQLARPLMAHSQLTIRKTSIGEFAHWIKTEGAPVTLVFANTVTEHLQHLAQDLRDVVGILAEGGAFFTNHDNYYQPVGSHDHGFLYYGRNNRIETVGPACWRDARKCDASASHRTNVARDFPWTWDDRNERTKDSANCHACHYYIRSQPWAHLIYQDQFLSLYPQESFHTGVKGGSLNKITPFQLKQLIIEAGFRIERDERTFVDNQPPEILVKKEHGVSMVDLRTTMVRILARKPEQH